MKQTETWMRLVAASCLTLAALLGSCFAEPNQLASAGGKASTSGRSTTGSQSSEGGAGGAEPAAPACVAREAVKGATCKPAISGESLRSRIVENVPQDTLYFTETLYGEFKALCGSCHGTSGLGGFSVSRTNFASVVDAKALAAIRSQTAVCARDGSGNKQDAGCYQFMPPDGSPNGKAWDSRKDAANDPVTRLAGLIELWLEAKRPDDAFVIPAGKGGVTPYAIDAETAETFTNIGTCVPDPGMVATELEQSCALDAKFAALEKKLDSALPEEQLGLPSTLDQTDLTTFDSAELARHGVIAYVPTYPLWSDDAGKLRYVRVPQGQSIKFNKRTRELDIPKNTRFYKTFLKKILDRDGVFRFRKIETRLIVSRSGEESLFGTYQWNEEETQATLVTDPLNSGYPFKDKLITVVTDVAKADAIKQQWMAGEVRNYSKELDYQSAVRRYAIPGSDRCVQCHMGGADQSFVLGFSPVQLYSRPCDPDTLAKKGVCEGGVIEPAIGDELTQLERLIDYGVVSDYDIKTQLITLEDAQGSPDAPRNYRSPEELRAQGYLLGNCAHCHNPAGYPSVLSPELKPLLNFRPNGDGGIFEFPLERYSPRILRALGSIQLPYITPSLRDIYSKHDKWTPKRVKVGKNPETFIDAPWRSLIYRNVDTPFMYADDYTLYPHMPLNTPGFDCRAPRVLGEWMVSVPALRKHPGLTEDVDGDVPSDVAEMDPQPYYEVKKGDANYLNGVAQAQKRLTQFRSGARDNNYCPETKDIIDVWDILYDPAADVSPTLIPRDERVKGLPKDGVPDRAHWVVTDLSDTPPPWNPRRSDWKSIVVDQNFSDQEKNLEKFTGVFRELEATRLADEKLGVELLHDLQLSGTLSAFVGKKLPFGLWLPQAGCEFPGVRRVKDFSAAERPKWMDVIPPIDPDSPVFETLPGAAVFNMVCVNCHGPDADSTGRQASTLQEMTGGIARVANFRDGLFGPPGTHGENRRRVFGSDDLGRRYLAWMALGGTKVRIPAPILDLVAATPVVGVPRPEAPPVTTANMLETPRALCRSIVTRGNSVAFRPATMNTHEERDLFHERSGLILTNGDGELWEKLCTLQNPSPVHALQVVTAGSSFGLFNYNVNLYRHESYPTSTAVGNVRGGVEASLAIENDFPWCVIAPTAPAELAFLAAQKGSDGKPLPVCPPALLSEANHVTADGPEVARFAARGAINAGLAVFAYLDDFVSEGHGRAPTYAECDKLQGATKP